MTWRSTAKPRSLYPSLGPLSSTSCFQVRAKVEALRMLSPDVTTRHAGGAVLCSIFFISLARAFTAINTVAKVSFSNTAIH